MNPLRIAALALLGLAAPTRGQVPVQGHDALHGHGTTHGHAALHGHEAALAQSRAHAHGQSPNAPASGSGRAPGTLELTSEPREVLPLGGSDDWDGSTVFGPCVVRDDDGYHLFYVGNLVRDPAAPARSMAVGYAFSQDGLRWTKHAGGPVLAHPVHGRATGAAVLRTEDGWLATFVVPGTSFGPGGEVHLASADAPTGPWRVEEEPVLRVVREAWNARLLPVGLFATEDGYRLHFWGGNRELGTTGLGYATSEDLVHWELFDDPETDGPFARSDPYLAPGAAGAWDGVAVTGASVVRTPRGWESFYVGYDRPIPARGEALAPLCLGRAASADGRPWIKDTANPLLETTLVAWPLTAARFEDGAYRFWQDTSGGRAGLRHFAARERR